MAACYLVQAAGLNLCLLLTDKNSYTTHRGIRTIETDIEVKPGGGIGANLMQKKFCKFSDCNEISVMFKTIYCCDL